ncbi:hypothetical protein [Holdemanella biformis]|jgi:hypothetical protein|uniref:Uncharacterized protein n=1 Tax=Holdemanella biformis TaxID=1735 RepID=A0A395WBK5_9FIRM|nr:hypothetical protein [Holdemanella biformis]RGU73056.1 hypothetical protein DWW49_03630 [Holdemanella biformis]RGU94134.1 hypothetical protein DWW32_01060 [Holdemanella biformis]
MKLLVEIKDKYTDITDIVNKSILDDGTKNGIVIVGSKEHVGFIESASLESINDLDHNLEWIAPTRLIDPELVCDLNKVKNALVGSFKELAFQEYKLMLDDSILFLRYTGSADKVEIYVDFISEE